MDARKLVGMTEGAKKRKARWESNSIMLPWRREWRAKYGREYSIGTKLRPCPGNGCRLGQSWCLRCDGSGVVPAKPKKVRR